MPSVDADGMSFSRKAYVVVATLIMQIYIKLIKIPKNFEIKNKKYIFALNI